MMVKGDRELVRLLSWDWSQLADMQTKGPCTDVVAVTYEGFREVFITCAGLGVKMKVTWVLVEAALQIVDILIDGSILAIAVAIYWDDIELGMFKSIDIDTQIETRFFDRWVLLCCHDPSLMSLYSTLRAALYIRYRIKRDIGINHVWWCTNVLDRRHVLFVRLPPWMEIPRRPSLSKSRIHLTCSAISPTVTPFLCWLHRGPKVPSERWHQPDTF